MRPSLSRKELDALQAADEIADMAVEAASPREAAAIARQALSISPLCAEAYVFLAIDGAKGAAEALLLWRSGVWAAETVLGEDGFESYAGEFWGYLETRPYMRAKHGLALALWACGERDEAIQHLNEMLRLNPNDNQGMRYLLVEYLLETGQDRSARAVLKRYKDDASAELTWPAALLEFRQSGNGDKSQRALAKALESNEHVPAYMLGNKRLPKKLPTYVGMGDAAEAQVYVAHGRAAWDNTPGAIEWLKETR